MINKFLVITHVEHRLFEGKFLGYPPYIKEMNIWGNYVKELQIIAPLNQNIEVVEPYTHQRIIPSKVPAFNILSLTGIIKSFFIVPIVAIKIFKAMRHADHFHIRCPGNIGLLACIVQIFFPNRPKTAKYAGNWDPEASQPWTYKLQRWILSNTFLTKNMKVLVYGEWPGQSENVKPFFTASFSEKTILSVQEKGFEAPYQFIFVGNLVPGKGLKMALNVIQGLQEKGVDCRMEIYGEGPEKSAMEAYVEEAEIKGIEFKGNNSLEELELAYQKAHFVILPSKSEGWPKAVAEGMFFGCIPIVTPVSCVPWMLGNGSRGILLDRGFNSEFRIQNSELERIVDLLKQPEEMKRMSREAKEWSQQYTLERFEMRISRILNELHAN